MSLLNNIDFKQIKERIQSPEEIEVLSIFKGIHPIDAIQIANTYKLWKYSVIDPDPTFVKFIQEVQGIKIFEKKNPFAQDILVKTMKIKKSLDTEVKTPKYKK